MGGLYHCHWYLYALCRSHRSQFDIELKKTQLSTAGHFLLQINLVFQDVGSEIVDS